MTSNIGYASEAWYRQFSALVAEFSLKEKNVTVALEQLAAALSKKAKMRRPWSTSYLFHVLHPTEKSKVNSPSPVFKDAVAALSSTKRRTRKDKLRICVPVESIEERDYINRVLTAPEKLNALLVAAHFEEE